MQIKSLHDTSYRNINYITEHSNNSRQKLSRNSYLIKLTINTKNTGIDT